MPLYHPGRLAQAEADIAALEAMGGWTVLVEKYVNQATTGTTEELLYTYTPAAALWVAGARFRVTAEWSTAANTNAKVPAIKLGGTAITFGSSTGNGVTLTHETIIRRTGSNAQRVYNELKQNGSIINSGAANFTVTDTTPPAIAFYGTTATALGDLTLIGVRIEYDVSD